MCPRKSDPEDLSLREQQYLRKQGARRAKGLPESELGTYVSLLLSGYRNDHGLTQQQLGAILGMQQPQIARLESGFVTPSLETLTRISAQLGIDLTIEVTSGEVTAVATPRGNRRA